MFKREGDPCPKCARALIRRKSTFRVIVGDVAYCAPCNASFEMIAEPTPAFAAMPA